jgi:copper(I)-binding protein
MRKIFRHHETARLFGGVVGALAVVALSTALAAEQPAATPAPGAQPPANSVTPAPDQAAKARAAAVAAKANIDIYEAWTRATASDAATAAINLKISSNKDADKLLGADSGASKGVEFREDGKAAAMATVDIPAGATIDFKPGGRQLVLTGLKAPLKEGDSFIVTLQFDKAGSESTSVRVLGANATAMPAASSTRKGDTTAAVSPLPKP